MRSSTKRLAVLGGVLACAIAIVVPGALAVTDAGTLSGYDPTMHGRLFRDGVPSTCQGKANPGLYTSSGLYHFDKYTFTNTASTKKIAHVFMQHACPSYDAFAQANAPFVHSNPSANYLGDAGQSASPESFSFPVAAGQTFNVVVGEVNPGGFPPPCTYWLTVQIGWVTQTVTGAVGVPGATDN
jgi:hypothetical protein